MAPKRTHNDEQLIAHNRKRFQISVASGLSILTLCVCCGTVVAAAQQKEPAKQLVREVVYNEQHADDSHGNWLYWIKQRLPEGTRLKEEVETHDGPVNRVLLKDGQPLDEETRRSESAKLDALLNSPEQQESRRQAYSEDEKRVGRILGMLPDAFLFEEAGQEKDCRHLRFHPDPAYNAHTIEGKVFHAISGDLWIDARMKRLVKLQGHMDEDLNFGFGLLGRVNKGTWFSIERTQVSPTEWKTKGLEIHVSGRAVLFKTVEREVSELRGGFTPVPAGLTFSQGVRLLSESNLLSSEAMAVQFAPVARKSTRRDP